MAWCWSCCNELPALPTTFSSRISPTLSGYLSLGRASSLSVFSDLSVLSCEHPRWQVQLTPPPARGYTNPWATDDVYHAPVTCAPIVDDGKSLMLSNDEVTSEYKQALATMRSRGGQQRGANKADSSEDQGREQDATLWALLERCEVLAHSLSPQGLANVWWALAVLKLPPASLCSSAPCAGGADAAAGRHAAQGSERSAGPGGARAGRAGQDHHATVAAQEAGAALMMSLEQPSPAPAGALQAEAAVRQGHVVVSASLERALKSRVLAVCAGRHFKGQEVSIILWSLATLSVAVEPALLSSLLLQVPLCPPSPPVFAPSVRCASVCVSCLHSSTRDQAKETTPKFSAQSVSNVLWALATLVRAPLPLLPLPLLLFLPPVALGRNTRSDPARNQGAAGLREQQAASVPAAREAGNIIWLCVWL